MKLAAKHSVLAKGNVVSNWVCSLTLLSSHFYLITKWKLNTQHFNSDGSKNGSKREWGQPASQPERFYHVEMKKESQSKPCHQM